MRSARLLRLGFCHVPSLLFRGPLSPSPSPGLGLGLSVARVGLVHLRCSAAEAGDGRGKKVSARLALAQQVMRDAEERAASAGSDPAPKITMDHVTVSFARSGGAGGQNVNKVNTKVDMRFNVEKAHWLGERIKERILQTAIIDAASYVPPPPSEEQKKKIEKIAAAAERNRMQNKKFPDVYMSVTSILHRFRGTDYWHFLSVFLGRTFSGVLRQ
ncbi:unnamed protein product [Triticum turgidum subsp. durum]|uniref:Prokaryotic-type class I peptide chain release factors domain-containing protein n=1 Tax=Triticum turgidum subsp. durum TaxID=4567 RepID=A0A9R0VXB2_TRITD|nr:unnamed protein product [Triticum turgidum subsp. durum]